MNLVRIFKNYGLGLAGLGLTFLVLGIFIASSPRATNIEFIQPNMQTSRGLETTLMNKGFNANEEGLFWLKFTTEPRLLAFDNLRLRIKGCVHEFSTSNGPWIFPKNLSLACENTKGLLLTHTKEQLQTTTEWRIAGSTSGGTYGVILDKDWTDPLVQTLFATFLFSIAIACFGFLKIGPLTEKTAVVGILILAFIFRFIMVFQISLPEMAIFSDMGGYFQRAWDISHNTYYAHHLFQPVGFTLWSLLLRSIGGFELFNWSQVFLSWGIVVLIYLIARQRFGGIAAMIALVFASIHVPQIGMAGFHIAENAYGFLITLALWWFLQYHKENSYRTYLGLGFILALAFYFKGNHAFFIPLVGFIILSLNKDSLLNAFKKNVAFAIGCLIVVAPHVYWTAKNYGKPSLGPTAGALNFVEGKCPSKDNEDSEGSRWMSPLFAFTGEREYKKWPRPFTDQAYYWQRGIECIKADPAVLATSFRYIHYLFFGNSLWPIIENKSHAWMIWWEPFFYLLLLPFAFLALLYRSEKKDPYQRFEVLLVLSLFFTVWLFKSENRFRVPFDAIFIGWSAYGVVKSAKLAAAFLKSSLRKVTISKPQENTDAL